MQLTSLTLLELESNERFWLYDILSTADIKDYPPDVKRFVEKLSGELR